MKILFYVFAVSEIINSFDTISCSKCGKDDKAPGNRTASTYWITPSRVGLGTHYNSILARVAGIGDLAWLTVCLTITGSDSMSSSLNLANYPNPFNPTTTITFNLPHPAQVRLHVYNIMGQKVITLIDRAMEAGIQTVTWDGVNSYGRSVSSGVYLYRLEAGTFHETRKMLLLK